MARWVEDSKEFVQAMRDLVAEYEPRLSGAFIVGCMEMVQGELVGKTMDRYQFDLREEDDE